jgi:hypothetical protein
VGVKNFDNAMKTQKRPSKSCETVPCMKFISLFSGHYFSMFTAKYLRSILQAKHYLSNPTVQYNNWITKNDFKGLLTLNKVQSQRMPPFCISNCSCISLHLSIKNYVKQIYKILEMKYWFSRFTIVYCTTFIRF